MRFQDRIQYMIDHMKPSSYGRYLKSKANKDLLEWLKRQVKYQTTSISELVFLYQNPNFSPICELGNKRKYGKNRHGFGYGIGCIGNCFCVKKSRNQKLSKIKKEFSSEKKKEIDAKKKKTFIEKYGVDNPVKNKEIKEKIQKTNLQRYGVEHALKNQGVREKIRNTNLKKYGVENVSKNKEIRNRIELTNLEKYGVVNPRQNQIVSEKIKNTNLDRYGYESSLSNPEIRNKIKKTTIEKYGVDHHFKNQEIKEKRKKTFIEKYGSEHPMQSEIAKQKVKKTNLEKYGVETPILNEQIKQKIIDTNLERYGSISSLSNQTVKEKIKQTNIATYGYDAPLQSPYIRKKIKGTLIKKYGVDCPGHIHLSSESLRLLTDRAIFQEIIQGKTIKQIQQSLSVDANTIRKYASRYQMLDLIVCNSSYLETRIEDFCKENSIEYITNTKKVISPLELDFYFPKLKSAIECHGLYWHSELSGKKTKDYHFNKWKSCNQLGIELYQYFEDEIANSFDVIKSKILYLNNKHQGQTIGARNLSIGYLNNHMDERDFYKNNHIQGFRPDRTHAIGAWLSPFELSAIMSIKHVKCNQLEIVRFATDINNRYPGVFTKILNWYINQSNFKGEILSWSDNRHSNGNLYKSNGFEFVKEQGPGYFITDYETRWRREHFMKAKIKQRHPEVDLSKTEWQLEQELGYDRIWDAGKILWKKII
jgi:hypothetical protein